MHDLLHVILLTISEILFIRLYFLVSNKYKILDIPNVRSSHQYATLRGGGIIFPFGIIVSICLLETPIFPFLISLIAVSSLSFLDDIISLKSVFRLVVQLTTISVLIYASWSSLSVLSMVFLGFFFLGFMNIYNFMDGINGMLVLQTFVVLLSLEYLNGLHEFSEPLLIHGSLVSCVVFGFFNFRKNARCFSGDVGSVTLGLFISYLLFELAIQTDIFLSLGLVMVFCADSGLTILERLIKKENILKAHRSHLYQLLANEMGLSHVSVSIIYGVTQAVISIGMILSHLSRPSFIVFFMFTIILSIVYVPLKMFIRRKHNV